LENFEIKIVELPAYKGIGLKWEGSYIEVGDLKSVINTMSSRVGELEHAVNPDLQLGLSYHLRPDGFVHYSVYEVGEEQQLPEGMIEIQIPKMTYLKVYHQKGQNIGQTYGEIFRWMKHSDYDTYREPGVEYYDVLPIKHERYPKDRDIKDPHFEIYIPVILRCQAPWEEGR
jgi:predicted transcriptional regulator YdeE